MPEAMSDRFLQHILAFVFAVFFILAPVRCPAQHAEGELLIGIEPEHNIFDQMERYRYLATYLSDQLGVKVNLTIMSRYGEVLKRFRSRKLDGAFLSSYTATLGIREMGLKPVASPVNLDGESTSRGYIFVRKDSGIQGVEDMRQRSIAYVDPATMEGYLFPLAYLKRNGISEPDTYFSRHHFTGSHASVVFAVLDGRADIGAARDTIYNKLVRDDPSIAQELLIIEKSAKVPEVTLCIRHELSRDIREKLAAVLLHMEKTSRGKKVLKQFGALRFIKTVDSDFEKIEKMARDTGATLADH